MTTKGVCDRLRGAWGTLRIAVVLLAAGALTTVLVAWAFAL